MHHRNYVHQEFIEHASTNSETSVQRDIGSAIHRFSDTSVQRDIGSSTRRRISKIQVYLKPSMHEVVL
ncbi:hypothetical protein JTE90_026221 [Oedothorax gibbosus]|uniref:Uncharacterized protein n=1 Tax=Oedothorax gibbosus TaxID=931172 RepID=A0AAV6U1B0_9ARAC|nr:hypothetical protein JTE90_026221 [Oedothorax gibbosus]